MTDRSNDEGFDGKRKSLDTSRDRFHNERPDKVRRGLDNNAEMVSSMRVGLRRATTRVRRKGKQIQHIFRLNFVVVVLAEQLNKWLNKVEGKDLNILGEVGEYGKHSRR